MMRTFLAARPRLASLAVGLLSVGALLASAGRAVAQPAYITAGTRLAAADVDLILRRAVDRANALGVNATIAVVDREGNLLGMVRMTTAGRAIPNYSLIGQGTGGVGGLEPSRSAITNPGLTMRTDGQGLMVVTSLTAYTKAGTAAFLSTRGNAFTTRTAAFIVQRNFPPGVMFQPGGPLFGVQFSSLPTSDVMRLPLGMSADSGGIPLYRNGECIGGIGVETGVTGVNDAMPANRDLARYQVDTLRASGTASIEEQIALAGQSTTFQPPANILASNILAGGIRFAYAYTSPPAPVAPTTATFIANSPANTTTLFAVGGAPATSFFTTSTLPNAFNPAVNLTLPGPTGTATSGQSLPAFVPGGTGTAVTPIAGAAFGGQNITTADVTRILGQAHNTNNALRAMIRRDTPQLSRVNVSVVDRNGTLLGIYRSEDAPIFGFDVCVQKARSALFFSRPDAGTQLTTLNAPTLAAVGYIPTGTAANALTAKYVTSTFGASSLSATLLNGSIAYGNRTIGFLARPNFPDGLDGARTGPFSAIGMVGTTGAGPQNQVFSVFNTGLQMELMLNNLAVFLTTYGSTGVVPGTGETTALTTFSASRGTRSGAGGATPGTLETAPLAGVPARSTVGEPDVADAAGGLPGRTLANGLQIFAGGVPIYKGGVLVGAVGVSGDGIEQDDNIAFDGSFGFRSFTAGTVTADNIVLPGNIRLPYVKFPRAPFVGTTP